MEKLEQIMDGNELCIGALRRENERLKARINTIEKSVFEGYYDEIGNYILTFNREKLEKALGEVFDAKEVTILH